MTYLIAQTKAHNNINKFLNLEQVDANVGVLAAMGTGRGEKPHDDLIKANEEVFMQLAQGLVVYVFDLDEARPCFLKVDDGGEMVIASYHFSPGYNSFDVKRTDGYSKRNITSRDELDELMGFASPEKKAEDQPVVEADCEKPVQTYTWVWGCMEAQYADEVAKAAAAAAETSMVQQEVVEDAGKTPEASMLTDAASSQMANAFNRARETGNTSGASTTRRNTRR